MTSTWFYQPCGSSEVVPLAAKPDRSVKPFRLDKNQSYGSTARREA
jgi:hypothetical protein